MVRQAALVACLLSASCALQTRAYSHLLDSGYVEVLEIHDVIGSVQETPHGNWWITFRASALNYVILRDRSPHADQLVSRARELARTGQKVYATFLIPEGFPPSKTPEEAAKMRAEEELALIVRIGDVPDPEVVERRRK